MHDVWLRYFGVGGSHTLDELHGYVYGDAVWTAIEHDIAALALNDYFIEHVLDPLVADADEVWPRPGERSTDTDATSSPSERGWVSGSWRAQLLPAQGGRELLLHGGGRLADHLPEAG